jgi:hypothetical protein
LNCFSGSLDPDMASFVPTEAPITTTTQKDLSVFEKVQLFFTDLVGGSQDEEEEEPDPDRWVPEALTIPVETNSTSLNENNSTSLIETTTVV